MKPIEKLYLGFNDAVNYQKRENRMRFNDLFVRTEDLENVLNRSIYFIIGDKGTGKTAISTFLSNNEIQGFSSTSKFIGDTEYKKFITLKDGKQIGISDYEDIWTVILYLLISQKIVDAEKSETIYSKHAKFKPLKEAIDDFYNKAFSPEISVAINFVKNAGIAASILFKYIELTNSDNLSTEYSETNFQLNLLYIRKKFEDALSSLALKKNHILFIDGIDLRPTNVSFEEYLECITGLTQAAWKVNSSVFSNIKDSLGRLKVVLLMRPDIINSVGIQNMNSKIRDNSVLLNWDTTYPTHRESNIFKVVDNLLNVQQEHRVEVGQAWDYYFPFRYAIQGNNKEEPFIAFLKLSMMKPRDIITMLRILKEIYIKNNRNKYFPVFEESDLKNSEFQRLYSEYVLGEIQDYIAFYHSKEDYELLLKFFEFLNGRTRFSFEQYISIYNNFADFVETSDVEVPIFFDSSDRFLQFLYEMNIIGYIEISENGDRFYRWSYRERTIANPNPQVKIGTEYVIHFSLFKAVKVGQKLKQRRVIRRKRHGKEK